RRPDPQEGRRPSHFQCEPAPGVASALRSPRRERISESGALAALGDDAKAIAEGIGAEGHRSRSLGKEKALHHPARRGDLIDKRRQRIDMEIEMHRGPVSRVAAGVAARLRALRPLGLFMDADARRSRSKYGHGRKRSRHFLKAE